MANDNQRREAAREIRQFLSVSQNDRAWDNDGLQTVGRLVGTSVGENILVRLADLIDRPTCKNLATKAADELLCSECGEAPAVEGYELCADCLREQKRQKDLENVLDADADDAFDEDDMEPEDDE